MTALTQCLFSRFPNFKFASIHRDAVFMIIRESTCLQRQFRDGVRATQVEESMLEDINSILNSGEIPNLFPQDELDKICSDMIPVCDALGVPASRDNCVATFVQRVWDKLHICLCMSPVGDALRVRCRQFPSLVNCCTIDWC